jgi:hypothetical protein
LVVVDKQLAWPFGQVVLAVAVRVFVYVHIENKNIFVVVRFESAVSFLEAATTFAQGFYFGAFQHYTGFVSRNNNVFMPRFSVRGDVFDYPFPCFGSFHCLSIYLSLKN